MPPHSVSTAFHGRRSDKRENLSAALQRWINPIAPVIARSSIAIVLRTEIRHWNAGIRQAPFGAMTGHKADTAIPPDRRRKGGVAAISLAAERPHAARAPAITEVTPRVCRGAARHVHTIIIVADPVPLLWAVAVEVDSIAARAAAYDTDDDHGK